MKVDGLDGNESKLETGISYLLIAGVIISLLLEIIGLVVFYHSYEHFVTLDNKSIFIQGHDFFSFICEQFRGNHTERHGITLMTAGVIVLILTPYLRVIASVIYFGWEKNIKYVLITLFVLVVVTLSLALH